MDFKGLASRALGVGMSRIRIVDAEKAAKAMTRDDIRRLVDEGALVILPQQGTSRGRARVLAIKKRKGRKRNTGKRRGTAKTRRGGKELWMIKVRAQRRLIKQYKGKIPANKYRMTYKMIKGGYFRSTKHLKEYLGGV